MPPSFQTQTIIAFIWDFDKTLTSGYMQKPLFDHYNVDERQFWKEVNALENFYGGYDLKVSADTAYLEHTLELCSNREVSRATTLHFSASSAHKYNLHRVCPTL